MGQLFEYEWWTVDVREATGRITYEVKAKNRKNAEKQVIQMASRHDEFIQKVRPDFKTEIYWETMKLDRTGYQRRF